MRRELTERSYRTYVTDSLRQIPQMSYLSVRWFDLMYGEAPEEIDADEIVDDVLMRLEGSE